MKLKSVSNQVKKPTKKSEVNRLEELISLIEQKEDLVNGLMDELRELRTEKFLIEHRPFTDGCHVEMEVPAGRSKKLQECVLTIVYDSKGYPEFRAVPIKEDGSFSSRVFIVYSHTELKLLEDK